ncbi:zinc ribbon domain-containing protein [Aeromicrobium sp. CTD01-1L150]|uniref:zinc ribbon domain-containing protein n=1 Tax=Aeromicrobium sp. CTD01-1L150 TaxID=3341830 RepID=UPI0035C0D0E9
MDDGPQEHDEYPHLKESALNADPAAQQSLLDVQAQDSTLAQLAHRRRNLPEHERVAELTEQITEVNGNRVEADTAVADLTRAQSKADAEVEQVKARKARDEERLNSGAVSNPKDLESLQHELVALDRRIATLEDEELEVMEQLEEAQTGLSVITADLEALRTDLAQVETARDTALAEIDERVAAAEQDRELVVAKVPDELLSLYDKVREQYGGLGAAALRARRCEGCRLELNGADLREIATRPEDEVLRCPECSRILVRTPESGL